MIYTCIWIHTNTNIHIYIMFLMKSSEAKVRSSWSFGCLVTVRRKSLSLSTNLATPVFLFSSPPYPQTPTIVGKVYFFLHSYTLGLSATPWFPGNAANIFLNSEAPSPTYDMETTRRPTPEGLCSDKIILIMP